VLGEQEEEPVEHRFLCEFGNALPRALSAFELPQFKIAGAFPDLFVTRLPVMTAIDSSLFSNGKYSVGSDATSRRL
jgi:hypothetical protein